MRSLRTVVLVAIAAALTLSCTADPGWVLRDGLLERRLEVKARGLELVAVDVVAPAAADGSAAVAEVGVVLLPGGLVEPSRYLWLARVLARSGMAVALPTFPLNLGFFAIDDARVARRVLVEGSGPDGVAPLVRAGAPIAVGGHSLGGVVAASAAVDGGYDALVLLASYAAGYDPVESLPVPVLSVAGELDCSARLTRVRTEYERFPPQRSTLAVVSGLTHYGFTDALTEDEKSGCLPSIPLEDGHARLADVVGAFLSARLRGDAAARQRLEDGIDGVVLEGAR